MSVTIGRRSLFMGTIAALVAGTFSGTAAAAGGSSGPRVTFAAQGKLGEIIVNPYKIAPLTAIIKNGGYELTEATVRIVPKKDGQEIKYKVGRKQLLTHAGIPVFGLYADYNNKVEVSYTRKFHGKTEKISETYSISRSERQPDAFAQYVRNQGRQDGSEVLRPSVPCQQFDAAVCQGHSHGLEQPDGRRDGMELLSDERHH